MKTQSTFRKLVTRIRVGSSALLGWMYPRRKCAMGDACHTCKRWHPSDEAARSPSWGWCEVEVMPTRWDYLCQRYKTRRPKSKCVGGAAPDGALPNIADLPTLAERTANPSNTQK